MTETMRSTMAAMARESATGGTAGIRPRPHVQRMMFVIWARLFFSLSADSADFPRLKACFRVIDARNPQRASDERIRKALKEIGEILRRRVAELRAQPEDAPGVLASIVRHHPAAVDDPTAIGNLIYEMHITWADLSGFLVWLLRKLTDHPEWSARLRADAGSASQGASPQTSDAALFVSETLRMEQSEHLYRVAKQDIEYDGIRIPRGWLVRLCVQESHRDPESFVDPDTFDPNRFRDHTYSRREYSPFGVGRRACMGSHRADSRASLRGRSRTELAGTDGAGWSHRVQQLASLEAEFAVARARDGKDVSVSANERPPRVTIVTAAYNAERFLSATIDSVRAQTFGDFEYIIIDDGSRDGTADVVRRHMDEDPRVRLVQQSNRGLAATRNAGIRAAHGELIAFLDHDDFWRPEKLALQIAALDANPKADVASCYSAVIGSDGAQLGWQFGGNANGDVYWEMLEWDMVSGGSVPLCRRAAFDRVGFFDESLPMRSDWDMWIRLARHGRYVTAQRVLVGYMRSPTSASRQYERFAAAGQSVLAKAAREDSRFSPAISAFAVPVTCSPSPACAQSTIKSRSRGATSAVRSQRRRFQCFGRRGDSRWWRFLC